MRVAGVELIGHPGVGDLKVDFRSPDGTAPRFVVIAGGNGSGKTAILETIFAALIPTNLLINSPKLVSGGRALVLIELDGDAASFAFSEQIQPELFGAMIDRWEGFRGYVIELIWQPEERMYAHRNVSNLATNTSLLNNELASVTRRPLACFYSAAQTEFDVPAVRSVTAISNPSQVGVPAEIEFPLFGGSDLADRIPQLFVDLENADGTDALRWLRQNGEGRPPSEMVEGRITRFTKAFSRLMPNKRFLGIRTTGGELSPVFMEGERVTPISKLSTGEKQVVFRGAFLLRRQEHLAGSVVLIDEPELSLHPQWQSGILDYYDSIVWEAHDDRSQVILSTHSPFVVHGSPSAKHIVLRRNQETGDVEVDPHPSYFDVSSSEVAVKAFDLVDVTFGQPRAHLVVVTEGKTDVRILQEAWRKIRPGRMMPFHLVPAGGAKSIMNLLGGSATDSGWLRATFAGQQVDRYLALYDFDDLGFGQWNGLVRRAPEIEELHPATCAFRKRRDDAVWAALLPVPDYRAGIANMDLGARSLMAIELMFADEYLDGRLSRSPLATTGSDVQYVYKAATESEKSSFAEATGSFPTEAFLAFSPLFDLVDRICAFRLETSPSAAAASSRGRRHRQPGTGYSPMPDVES